MKFPKLTEQQKQTILHGTPEPTVTLQLDSDQARVIRVLCTNAKSRARAMQAGISGEMIDSILALVNATPESTRELSAEQIADVRKAYNHFRQQTHFANTVRQGPSAKSSTRKHKTGSRKSGPSK